MTGRELLEGYISRNTTQAQFARDVGCSESHLSLLLDGKRGVSFRLARRISEATKGEVPLEALDLERQDAAE